MAGLEFGSIHERAGLFEKHLLDQIQIVYAKRSVSSSKAPASKMDSFDSFTDGQTAFRRFGSFAKELVNRE